MGRQVNFYMSKADEREFEARILESGGVLLAYRQEHSGSPDTTSLDAINDDVYASELCIARSCDLATLSPKWDHPIHGRWLLDEDNDRLIQFHRSRRTSKGLESGRIWIQTYRLLYDPETEVETMVSKPADFVQYYDGLARWIRKRFGGPSTFNYWCGPGAQQLQKEGVALLL